MHQKRILLVGNFLSASVGIRCVCEELAIRLVNAGWQVYTTSHQPNRILRLFDMLFTTWKNRDNYVIAQVDVYSGLAFIWAEAVCYLLKLIKKPFILTLHGGNLPEFAHRWPKRVNRLLMDACAVTVPSKYLFNEMACYRKELQLLPNPIDINSYMFRQRCDVRLNLMWLRSFHVSYNQTLAIEVLRLLKPEFPDATLTMIGPDSGDGSLQSVIQILDELGLGRSVILPGAIPKHMVSVWLNKGDIFINTTNVDNTPISVIEAMACGLCVISTKVGGIQYLLGDGEDSLLVPHHDPQAMANAIKRLKIEAELVEQLSYNARQKAESFDWSSVFPKWESLLFNIIEREN